MLHALFVIHSRAINNQFISDYYMHSFLKAETLEEKIPRNAVVPVALPGQSELSTFSTSIIWKCLDPGLQPELVAGVASVVLCASA